MCCIFIQTGQSSMPGAGEGHIEAKKKIVEVERDKIQFKNFEKNSEIHVFQTGAVTVVTDRQCTDCEIFVS